MQEAVLSIQAIVDFLGRRNPTQLQRLQTEFPGSAQLLSPGKRLGVAEARPGDLLRELANATLSDAKAEGTALARRLRDKAKLSSRLRLFSSIVSALSSGTLVAAIAKGSIDFALVNGVIVFLASAVALGAQYVEDYMGGQKSLRELRDAVTTQVLQVAEVDAEFRLMSARNDFSEIEPLIRKLNVALASFRVTELTLQ